MAQYRIALLIIFFFSFVPQAFAESEHILSFDSDIIISRDATVRVVETITYDFGGSPAHGIFRTIPVVYSNADGKRYQAEFTLSAVTDEAGAGYPFSAVPDGDNKSIKIGDPAKTITGEHTYVISYLMKGPVQYYADHDELYWNVTGNDWDVPIDTVHAQVTVEGLGDAGGELKGVCYEGEIGSVNQQCSIENAKSSVSFRTESLGAGEGVTIAVSFPKGIVDTYQMQEVTAFGLSLLQQILLGIAIFLLYLVLPIAAIIWWYRNGRDPKIDPTIVRGFDPPKTKNRRAMTPMEVGALVDESIDPRDISAEIVNLAIKKYIHIKEHDRKFLGFVKGDIEFMRGEAFSADPALAKLTAHERAIVKALNLDTAASVLVKDLKKTFPEKLEKLQDDVYTSMVSEGVFPENPKKRRNICIALGFVGLFTGNVLLSIVLFVLSKNIGRRTQFGAEAKRYGMGLKEFLGSQERQLTFQEEKYFLFEKLLPYAIVFGVATVWAKRFEGMTKYRPDWYESAGHDTFTPALLVNNLNHNLSSIQQSYSMTSSTSSSGFSSGFGGGSSGGGFSGGGGGSW